MKQSSNLEHTGLYCPHLNLPAIGETLRDLQANFAAINNKFIVPRDKLTNEVVDNMLLGYQFIDEACSRNVGLLGLGNSRLILELNARVLRGLNDKNEFHCDKFAVSNAKSFYDANDSGIGAFMEYLDRHVGDDPTQLAAGVYMQVVSYPQLFIEGNHRTGALLASYILMQHALPPFVLSKENAKGFCDLSISIKECSKTKFNRIFKLRALKKRLVKLFAARSNKQFLTFPK